MKYNIIFPKKESYEERTNIYDYSNDASSRSLIEPITKKEIDLIHMFCVIDACYGNEWKFDDGTNTDILSWAGDLQSAAHEAAKGGESISHLQNNKFASEADLLADIDGRNIAFNYLKYNTLSKSLIGYFIIDNCSRFEIFKQNFSIYHKPLGVELDSDFIFKDTVYYLMGVNWNGEGIPLNIKRHYLLVKYFEECIVPQEICRFTLANEFIDYVNREGKYE